MSENDPRPDEVERSRRASNTEPAHRSSQQAGFGKLYGQLPPGASMVPRWLQVAYSWIMITMVLALITWFAMRMVGFAYRGNTTAALIASGVGLVGGAIGAILVARRK